MFQTFKKSCQRQAMSIECRSINSLFVYKHTFTERCSDNRCSVFKRMKVPQAQGSLYTVEKLTIKTSYLYILAPVYDTVVNSNILDVILKVFMP